MNTDLKSFDVVVSRLYTQGRFSTREIASALQCSQGKVARSLRRSGTAMRDFSSAVRGAWRHKVRLAA